MPDGTATPTLTRAYRCDRGTVAEFTRTPEGYVRTIGRIAKPGIMTYRDSYGKVTRELVPAKTLQDPEFLASLENKPLTVEHPPVMLTPENIGEYRKGMVLAPVVFDGGYVTAPIQIDDADAIAAMRSGKVELSPGYEVDLDPTPGTDPDFGAYDAVQVKRYGGNHTALCDRARGGADIRLIRTDSAVEVAPEAAADPAPSTLPTEPPVYKMSDSLSAAMKAHGYSDDDIAACKSDDDAHTLLMKAAKKDDDMKKDEAPEIAAKQAEIQKLAGDLAKAQSDLAVMVEKHELLADDAAPEALEALADDGPMMDDAKSAKMDSARKDAIKAGRSATFKAFHAAAMARANLFSMALTAGVPRMDAEAMGADALAVEVAKRRFPAEMVDSYKGKPEVLRALLTTPGIRLDSDPNPIHTATRTQIDNDYLATRTGGERADMPIPSFMLHPNNRKAQ